MTKNPDIDKYKYSGYGIGFERREEFSLDNGIDRNVIISGLNLSSSPDTDNKKKDLLILDKGPTQGLEHTMTAQKMNQFILAKITKKFRLNLHYNGTNSYLFVNGSEIIKFKAKASQIVATPLCLGNVS